MIQILFKTARQGNVAAAKQLLVTISDAELLEPPKPSRRKLAKKEAAILDAEFAHEFDPEWSELIDPPSRRRDFN